ncbi:MAG: M67 family metallopeptidase [Anaerolineae bacterium]
MRQLVLAPAQWEEMRAHVDACLPLEACGLLAGSADVVQAVIAVPNMARSPVRFRMDPRAQWRAFERIEDSGWDLLAIYHSHPAGPDAPSETDIAEAAYQVIHLIWSRSNGAWAARGFWIDAGRVSDVKLDFIVGA